jgi:DNA-binding response OmpR family regulator
MENTTAPKIAIVGNDADFCYLMQRYVRQGGYRIIVTHLGGEASALVSREQPAAVVLEFDVFQAAERVLFALKAEPAVGSVPIIVCSWRDEEELGLLDSVAGYLRKPVLYEDFLAALRQAGVPQLNPK